MEPGTTSKRLAHVEAAVVIADRTERPAAPPARPRIQVVPGEVSSFEDFYVSNHDRIARALALTLADTQLGIEATDEAMTRAYQRWDQVRGYDNPSGWVYRVGLNWARSFLRKRRRSGNSPFDANVPTEAVHDPDPSDPTLAASLASLDEKHRAVVVLRYLLDWSVEQTAEALDIAPGTVKSRLHRALTQLQAQMGPQGDS